jgi:hypothetical protein
MKCMRRKLFCEVATLLGLAVFIFPDQSKGTSIIVIRAADHVILASDSLVIHDGKAVDIPAKKITFTKNGVATGVTGTAVLGQFNLLQEATTIAEAHKFADQTDLHDIAQKWAEYTRDSFAALLKDHHDQVAKIVTDGEKYNRGIYADAIFAGFGKNGDVLISASLVKIAKDSQGTLGAFITEVIDAPPPAGPSDGLLIPRAYAQQTSQRLQEEIVTNGEHLDIVNGLRSTKEEDQICGAAKFTALAGKWYPQFVGGDTQLLVVHRNGIQWPTIPDSCRK